jgi:hypothetical protein
MLEELTKSGMLLALLVLEGVSTMPRLHSLEAHSRTEIARLKV